MGIFGTIAGWFRRSTTSNPEQWFVDWIRGGASSATGITVNQLRAMQEATVLACVSIRAVDVAKLPVHVYRRRADGSAEILANHALERLLQRPNGWQTRLEFIEQMQAALLLRSNAYAALLRDGRGRCTAMVPLNPDNVTLWEGNDGGLYYRVVRQGSHESAVLSGLPELVPAEDMLHLRWLSLNGLTGLSRIGLLKESIGLSLAQEETAARLFGNGARPSGFLMTDRKLTDMVYDRLRKAIREKYQGLENAGEIPILEEGLKWEQATMSLLDADFMKGREFQVAEIARAYDVPPHRLGIGAAGGGAAILQANQMYLNNTVSSDVERWEAKLNDAFDLDGEQEFVEFDLDYFNRADIQTRFTAYRTGVVGMIVTPNEARRREGWPAVEGGDVLYQPTNVAPIGFQPQGNETGPGSDVTGEPAPGGDGDPSAVPDAGKSRV